MRALAINGERLWERLMEMALIGATPRGGVCRLAASAEDGAGRDLLSSWCRAEGLEVRVDRVGNMFGRRQGWLRDQPPIMIGSHLDTQPTGGKFDGAYGVLAALEVVQTLNEAGIGTDCPIDLVNWTNEEGCRFQPSCIGSEVFAGGMSEEDALARQDRDGVRLDEALKAIGYLGDCAPAASSARAYLEGHIEQGPILEEQNLQVGIVEGGMGVNAYEVTLTGKEAHTGSTPVERRRDALLAAAGIVTGVYELAKEYEPNGRATVAQLNISPNVRSVVPGRVVLTSDCRHRNAAILERMNAALRAIIEREAHKRCVRVDIAPYWSLPAQAFDTNCVSAVEKAAHEIGVSYCRMYSGAAHDAVAVARVVPTAMIFVPSKGGLSHNEAEYTSPADIAAGANVLLHAVLAIANS